MLVEPSQTMTCIKTGCIFSMSNNDQVFVGDLFFDYIGQEFQMRGIPSIAGVLTHILRKEDKGPFRMMMFIEKVKVAQPRLDGRHVDLSFRSAQCTNSLGSFIQEYNASDNAIHEAMENYWTFVSNLHWVK
ncbi:MAG: hypothetical protein PF495_00720 [Spirochaetales bacterium]|jgi:hypothetical protein|nr:hypothetical protein [Spirochaetales bacterium]